MNEEKIKQYENEGSEKGISYEYQEGEFDETKEFLKQKIKEIKSKRYIKIGKSSTPNERFFNEYKLNGFEKMIVIYKSDKQSNIESAEEEMLNEFIDDLDVLNFNEGSAGPLGGSPHYLYVVYVHYDVFPRDIVQMIVKKFERITNKMKSSIIDK